MRNNVQQPPGPCCHCRPDRIRSSNADGQIQACADQLISASPAQPKYQTVADDFKIGRARLK